MKIKILNKFMLELKMSGYSEMDRYEILRSGYISYEKLILKKEMGLRLFYQSRHFEREKTKGRKQEEKTNWFKKEGNTGKQFASVFFVPSTPAGQGVNSLKC